MVRVSVLLATFDQPRALALALEGYGRQSFRDFEVVVADDGSGPSTAAVVEEFRRCGAFSLKHVWQENRGFRKARMANKAIHASEGELLVFSDGDCVPPRGFLQAHVEGCPKGGFATGGYIRLTAGQSLSLTREGVSSGAHEAFLSPSDRWRFRVTHWKNLLGILLGNPRRPKVYGCNLSIWRDACREVNGFDENFDGFGKEDSDLRNRLRRHGVRPASLWGRAWVVHVDDALDPGVRARRIPRRDPRPYFGRPDVPVRCPNGLEKLG